MKDSCSAFEVLERVSPRFWWPFFGFMAVSIVTAGVTLTAIFAPSYPPLPAADFDAVQYCLRTKAAYSRCKMFFESDIAHPYMTAEDSMEES